VPDDPGVLDWADYMGSVDAGTAALGGQYAAFTAQCPTTKVVLAGYSQGAMVVHRNLQTLGANPNLAAALLIADGDRIPDDTTVNIGSASTDPKKTGGAAQDWPILAHAPAKLPANVGVRTISVCDAGDASVTTTRMPTRCRRRPWRFTRATPPGERRADVDLDGPPTSLGAPSTRPRGPCDQY
jgi:hypothetical protein